jgi:hypothetical protein
MGHLDGPMGVAKKDGERTRTAGGFGSLLPITGLLDGGRPQSLFPLWTVLFIAIALKRLSTFNFFTTESFTAALAGCA